MAVHEVRQTDSELAALIDEFQSGEDVILARGGQAVARVVACSRDGSPCSCGEEWPGECAESLGRDESERALLD